MSWARAISNMLGRGVVTLANAAGKMQLLQVQLLADEAKDNVEYFEHFGFTSVPRAGAEVLAVFMDGDRSNGIILCATDRRYRPIDLAAGDVVIYDGRGAEIRLTASGITIKANGHPVTVTGGDVIADGISLKTHKHGGVQSGGSQTGGPV